MILFEYHSFLKVDGLSSIYRSLLNFSKYFYYITVISLLWLPWWLIGKRIHLAMQETWVRSLGQEDPLEEEIATGSSILPKKIPWTEETGRLQSIRSQRIGHD